MSEQAFIIDDLDKAGWAMRKLEEARKEVSQAEAYADRERQRIDHWLKKECDSHRQTIAHMEYLLTDYYQRMLAANPRARLSTPYGQVTKRRQKRYHYGDEDTLMTWLSSHGQAHLVKEKVTHSIDKVAFKKELTVTDDGHVVTADGELVEGVTVTEDVTYTVSTEVDT